MMVIERVRDEQTRHEFTDLPGSVRPRRFRSTDPKTEYELLTGQHPLSADQQMTAWVVRRRGEVVGRLAHTRHFSTGRSTIGFFDCVNDQTVANVLFRMVGEFAGSRGETRLLGPVDGSFWLSYRLKMDGFDVPAFPGEPLNPPWYPRLWADAGFAVASKYASLHWPADRPTGESPPLDGGVAASRRRWSQDVEAIHGMLASVYAANEVFTPIAKDAFARIIAPLKWRLDLSCVTLARREGRIVGFHVPFPDHGPRRDWRVASALRAVRATRAPSRLVSRYVGVDAQHQDLVHVLRERFAAHCAERGIASVEALRPVTADSLLDAPLTTHHALLAKDV